MSDGCRCRPPNVAACTSPLGSTCALAAHRCREMARPRMHARPCAAPCPAKEPTDDAIYREGRVILDKRSARASAKRTDYAREVQSSLWTNHEFETLRMLYEAGADVPRP